MTKIATITLYASEREVLLEIEGRAPGLTPHGAEGPVKITTPVVHTGDDRAGRAGLEALRALVSLLTREENARSYTGDAYPLQIEVRRPGRAPEVVRYGKSAGVDGHEVIFPDGRRLVLTSAEWIAIGLVSLCDASFAEETVRLYREQLILGFAGPFLQAADAMRARLATITETLSSPPVPQTVSSPMGLTTEQVERSRRTAWAHVCQSGDRTARVVLATALPDLPPEEAQYLRWLACLDTTQDDMETLRRRVDGHLHAAWSRTTKPKYDKEAWLSLEKMIWHALEVDDLRGCGRAVCRLWVEQTSGEKGQT